MHDKKNYCKVRVFPFLTIKRNSVNSVLFFPESEFCSSPLQHETTQEKPHACEICGRGFAKVSDVRRHQVIHTGHKPHSCNVCGKAFTHAYNMKRHQLTHTGMGH